MNRFDSVWDTEDAVASQDKAMDKDKLQIYVMMTDKISL